MKALPNNNLKVFTFLFLCLFTTLSNAENYCFDLSTFTSFETASINEIRLTLEKENWIRIEENSSSNYSFIDKKLNFNVVMFESELRSKIYICMAKDVPNLIIFRTNKSCFNSMLEEAKKSGYPARFTRDSCTITDLAREGQMIEFRESQFSGKSEYYIIDYRPTIVKYNQIYLGFKSNNSTSTSNKNANKNSPSTEIMPSFPGGDKKMIAFILENLEYPALAIKKGITGRVVVEFIIDKEDNIVDPKVINHVGGGCDEEALRIVSLMPKWTPGFRDGEAVKTRYFMPIEFDIFD
jgi:TonB family protein